MPKTSVLLSATTTSQTKSITIEGATSVKDITFTPTLASNKFNYTFEPNTSKLVINLVNAPATGTKTGNVSMSPLKSQTTSGVEGNGTMTCTYNNGKVTSLSWVKGAACESLHYTYDTYSVYEYTANIEYENNSVPNVSVSAPTDAQTIYENTAYTISGNATDADNGNIVNIRYSINDGTARALATGISDGATAIPFAKTLTFKNGKLFDGATAITDGLAEGTAHMLRVWATDDAGATSTIISRSFYAVPNRAPSLTVDAPQPSGTINSDKFAITGTCSDIDGNEVTVAYRINGTNPIQVYKGHGGAWSFDVSLAALDLGENSIVIEVTDSYNFKATKTVRLNKNEIKTPVNTATARYKLTPPKGSATGVLLWVRRTETLQLDAKTSMVLAGEQEQYFAPTDEVTTAQVSQGIVEDEFIFETAEAKTDIVLKLEMTKTQENDAITLITGVFN